MVTIHINENTANAKAFIDFAKTLKFVEFDNQDKVSKKQKLFLEKLKRSADEARLIGAGKIKGHDLLS